MRVMKQKQRMDADTSGAAAGGSAILSGTLQLGVTPRSLAGAFGTVVALLLVLHCAVQTARFMTGDDRFYGLVYMFSVGSDGNIPTFYSAFALLFCSGLLALTGLLTSVSKKPMKTYWYVLALIFVFLATDEMLELHEKLIEPLRAALQTSGMFHYAWIIPYAIATGAIGGVYLKFLLSLPRRTGIGFVISGSIFIAGAVGLEMVGGVLFESVGGKSPGYVVAQTIEEALEMIGIVMFIYFIADYIVNEFSTASISLVGD